MIKIINLTKEYKDKSAIDSMDLELPDTGLVIIKGENGSGKTTLMNMLSTLDSPTKGTIMFDELEITNQDEPFKALYREKYVGFIFQDNNLFENMTVEENINIVGGFSKKKDIINLLNLEKLLSKKVKYLSGGEQKRVAIARVLVKNPKFVIADEPTSSIDYDSKKIILNVLRELSKNRLVILISHDMICENAEDYCDEIIELEKGKIKTIKLFRKRETKNTILPFKNNFKIRNFAFKNLFINKKKIIRSSICLVISLLFILVAISVNKLNYIDMHADTMNLEKDDLIIFNKLVLEDGFYEQDYLGFNEKDIQTIKENKISKQPIQLAKTINIENEPLSFNIKYDFINYQNHYYKNVITKINFINIDDSIKLNKGRLPKEANELVISSYLAEQIIYFGIEDYDGNVYKPKNLDELVNDNRKLLLGNQPVIICGIKYLDTSKFKNIANEENFYAESLFEDYTNNLAGDVFVKSDFFNLFNESNSIHPYYQIKLVDTKKNANYDLKGAIKTTQNPTLDKFEIIINEDIIDLLELNIGTCIGKNIKLVIIKNDKIIETLEFTIKGISTDEYIHLNEETLQNYLVPTIKTEKVILNEGDKKTIKKIFQKYPVYYDELVIKTNYSLRLVKMTDFFRIASKIIIIFSLLFVLLAIFYIYNYIKDSIDTNQKNIAILKSLGVSNFKILSIFIVENIVLIIISYITTLLLYLPLRIAVNQIVSNKFAFEINFMPFYIDSFILILLIVILICTLISIMAFKKIEEMSPQLLFKKESI